MLINTFYIPGFFLESHLKYHHHYCTLMKKKIKFSSYIKKFRVEHLKSHIWQTASSYMGKYLRISSYIRKPFLIYVWLCNCSTQNFLIMFMRKIWFSFFISVHTKELVLAVVCVQLYVAGPSYLTSVSNLVQEQIQWSHPQETLIHGPNIYKDTKP